MHKSSVVNILAPCKFVYILSILGKGIKDKLPCVSDLFIYPLHFWLEFIDFSEVYTHSASWGLTGCRLAWEPPLLGWPKG